MAFVKQHCASGVCWSSPKIEEILGLSKTILEGLILKAFKKIKLPWEKTVRLLYSYLAEDRRGQISGFHFFMRTHLSSR